MNQPRIDLPTRLLTQLSPWRAAATWHIAFSGGLDSTVLLHLLASLSKTQTLPPLRALHVHHGLQAVADAWPDHCHVVCKALGVPLEVMSVQVPPGASLERAAREARYGAFAAVLHNNEVLLTGQHRDDQAETLLFRLLRGAGVRGLSAMPRQRPLGQGHLLRPLLDVSRAELEAYATQQGLSWVEDPSNDDHRYARNFLRQRVFPVLTEQWPQASATLARSAAHLSEAQGLLDDLARIDLERAVTPGVFDWLGLRSLELAPLRALSPARQRNALSHWLVSMTTLPDSDHWSGWDSLRDAADDARPIWRLAAGELHRAGGRLWWLSDRWLRPAAGPVEWTLTAQALALPDNGTVTFDGKMPDGPLCVRYRQGGEAMMLPGRGHRDLKRLLNESGVPAFARGRLPLLYRDEQLLAVAGLPGLDSGLDGTWQLIWQP
ncbi:tRNA lysidine(34) synthetase TilS [Pseudomonas fluorescens]|uniref:tRNA(Ile)-lysidine synthase n=1 Tax=Pseudomonas fluorescens TaxID=294 RepID=A0A944DLI5_PSEFL|nr:tRNA lysidine(34) synthetase TilS [Pseudomonas fluorescens]MBT2295437.1 tRNA lysidine(34) synthetase TilS [Pseudomonas fluorescens]MBT2308883.1 tRNA lysidine(34) synthetase TilS [Pseudomonas fluorescens]MBT2312364.1 tRNA lysidine(34) synthetase TilS [Pseudomonas fluorescens]MBT2318069.1 tRNA lysidine(34) synthetase TilS [Pseudomonas fluorescens]MBT2330959.1 tRNA lysidine(34) synthetase TilS [Pseudomonas fluorescens]